MTAKQVSIGTRPGKRHQEVDRWIQDRTDQEPIKRLTLDLPASLHARVKMECAREGISMKAMLIDYLSKKYPDP